jgi:hypothetical protein
MKRIIAALCLALTSAPAAAQIADPDVNALMKRWVETYNKGDAAGMAKDVYANGDEAKFLKMIEGLRADSFGKLDIYDFKSCPVAGDKTKVQMNYARIYTFGGKMNDDESKTFDLSKTPAGWRVTGEADGKYGDALSCG